MSSWLVYVCGWLGTDTGAWNWLSDRVHRRYTGQPAWTDTGVV